MGKMKALYREEDVSICCRRCGKDVAITKNESAETLEFKSFKSQLLEQVLCPQCLKWKLKIQTDIEIKVNDSFVLEKTAEKLIGLAL